MYANIQHFVLLLTTWLRPAATPTEQKALLLTKQFGDFVVLPYAVPKVGTEEVLVKIHAAALNPVDWKIQKYGIFIDHYPTVLGADIAGEVVELGEGVSQVTKGDRVLLQGIYNVEATGGYQQYANADVHTLAKIPSNISYDEAATIPATLSTAWIAFYNVNPHGAGLEAPLTPAARGKYAGTPIVIVGGSGSASQFAIQLAKLSGFNPIITTASPRHAEFLKSLGATHVLDRNLPLTKASVEAITDKPVHLVFDGVSLPDTQEAAYSLLAPESQLVLLLPPSESLSKRASRDKQILVSVVGSKALPHNVALLREFWAHATSLLESGDLKPNRPDVLSGGLDGVVGGLKRLEEGRVSGVKLVVRPQETV